MPLKEVVGGIYSLQPLPSHWLSLLTMGTPDSPMVHRTGTVHCPVRATSARPLGFGAVDHCPVRARQVTVAPLAHRTCPVQTEQSGDL